MIVTGDSHAKFRRGWAGWPKRLRISSASASTHASYDVAPLMYAASTPSHCLPKA